MRAPRVDAAPAPFFFEELCEARRTAFRDLRHRPRRVRCRRRGALRSQRLARIARYRARAAVRHAHAGPKTFVRRPRRNVLRLRPAAESRREAVAEHCRGLARFAAAADRSRSVRQRRARIAHAHLHFQSADRVVRGAARAVTHTPHARDHAGRHVGRRPLRSRIRSEREPLAAQQLRRRPSKRVAGAAHEICGRVDDHRLRRRRHQDRAVRPGSPSSFRRQRRLVRLRYADARCVQLAL